MPQIVLRRFALPALLGCLVAAQPAAAANIGAGQRPHVAGSPLGVVHAVWSENAGPPTGPVNRYCRIAPGDEKCTIARQLEQPLAAESDDPPFVLVKGNRVLVVQSRCCDPQFSVWVWESQNGGEAFAMPRKIADNARITRAATLGRTTEKAPGDAVFGLTLDATAGVSNRFQMIRVNGPPPEGNGSVVLDTQHGANAAIATFVDDLRAVAVFDRNEDAVIVRSKPKAQQSFSAGDYLNGPQDWDIAGGETLVGAGSARLANAGANPYLLVRGAQDSPQIARITQNGTSDNATLADYTNGEQAVSFDGTRPHAVWVAQDESGADSLLYSFGKAGGSYSKPVELAVANDLRNIALAMGQGGGGVSWSKEFVSADNSTIRFISIPAASKASAAARAGASIRSPSRLAALKADAPLGKGGTVASVLARNGCQPRRGRYLVRTLVGNKPSPRFLKRRVKVRRVSFRLGHATRVDRRGPFRARFSTKGLRRGSGHRVTVTVFARKQGHIRAIKKLRYSLRVCR